MLRRIGEQMTGAERSESARQGHAGPLRQGEAEEAIDVVEERSYP
jgi:hypothetical protein